MYPDSGPASDCLIQEVGRHDARLRKLHRERLAQFADDAAASQTFRNNENNWRRELPRICSAALSHATTPPGRSDYWRCVIAETDKRADYLANLIRGGAAAVSATDDIGSEHVPFQLWGKWTVSKILRASTVSCWDQKQADAVVGTEIEYSANSFRWKDKVTKDPAAQIEMVADQKFTEDHSGSSSFVNLKQLGFDADSATQITITHADAEITGATTEIPGDTVLIVDSTHIVFSLCNVYFLAVKQQ